MHVWVTPLTTLCYSHQLLTQIPHRWLSWRTETWSWQITCTECIAMCQIPLTPSAFLTWFSKQLSDLGTILILQITGKRDSVPCSRLRTSNPNLEFYKSSSKALAHNHTSLPLLFILLLPNTNRVPRVEQMLITCWTDDWMKAQISSSSTTPPPPYISTFIAGDLLPRLKLN